MRYRAAVPEAATVVSSGGRRRRIDKRPAIGATACPGHASPRHVLIPLEAAARSSSVHSSVVARSQTRQPTKRSPASGPRASTPHFPRHAGAPPAPSWQDASRSCRERLQAQQRPVEPHDRSGATRLMIELQGPPKMAGVRSRHLHRRNRKGCCYRAATSEVHLTAGGSKGLPATAPAL